MQRQFTIEYARYFRTSAREDLDRALELISQVIELNPSASAHNMGSKVYHELGDIKEAISDIDEAIRREPGDFEYLSNRQYLLGLQDNSGSDDDPAA